MVSTQVVGILGGMGPAAGADFVRLFVQACAQQLSTRPALRAAEAMGWRAESPALR